MTNGKRLNSKNSIEGTKDENQKQVYYEKYDMNKTQ